MIDVKRHDSHLVFILMCTFAFASASREFSAAEQPNYELNDKVQVPRRYVARCTPDFQGGSQHLRCFHGINDAWDTGSDSIESLTITGWREKYFDAALIATRFPNLKNLSVFDSNFTRLSSVFPATADKLQIVTFNGTKLRTILNGAFSKLSSLAVLDLRHNQLESIGAEDVDSPSLKLIYLSGNPWKCGSDLTWILNLNNDSVASRVVDRDKLLCVKPFEKCQVVTVLEIMQSLREECRKTVCSCEVTWVNNRPIESTPDDKRTFAFVNCSSKGLTELPSFLPANTTALDLSYNQISDLSLLNNDHLYGKVVEIFLDNNAVQSINQLEDSHWLENFWILSLRDNQLSDLPTYALENAIKQNKNNGISKLFLGNNPWRCDCSFTPGFQNLLIRHPELFVDVSNITCKHVDGDKNSGKQIHDLSRTAICIFPEQHSWIGIVDVLNVVMASLILFIIGKLLYDYYTFKKSGKLPWIVARIP